MTHSERIERIARAMCVSDLERLFDEDEIAERMERAVGDYRRIARVAYLATLESLREPSEAITNLRLAIKFDERTRTLELMPEHTGLAARGWFSPRQISDVWRAMIDAAIKEAE